jgi:kinesin family protein 5
MGTNVKTGAMEPIPYVFDQVYDPSASQAKLYETAVTPIVDSVLKGYNGTILAYGQTGAGKSYTMSGPDIESLEDRGIIPRMVSGLFK